MSLRPRANVFAYLLVSLSAMTAMPVLVLGNRFAAQSEQQTLREEDAAAGLEVEATRREIELIMRARTRVLDVIGGSVEAVGMDKVDVLEPIVDAQREHSASFDSLYVANRDGLSIVASFGTTAPGAGSLVGVSYAERDYYQELIRTEKTSYSKVQRGKLSGVPNVHIAVPVHDAAQRVAGFVCGGVQISLLAEAAEKSAQARGQGRIVVVDDHGQIIADTSHALGALAPAVGVLETSLPSGSRTTVVGVDEGGRAVRASGTTMQIGSHTWRVWSMTPVSVLEAEFSRVRGEALRITLAALFIALVVAAFAAWWTSRALLRVAAFARKVGDGAFDLAVPQASALMPKELAELRDAASLTLQRLGDNDRQQRELLEQLEATTAAQRPLAEAWAQVTDGVAILDPEGRVLFVNPAYERLTGQTSGELVGGRAAVLSDDARDVDDRPLAAEVRAAMERGEPWRGDLRTMDFRGEPAVHRVTMSPVLDASGALERVVKIRQDVTEQLRVESKLRDTERLASIGTLAAGVAHEINNPLTYIKMNLELIRDTLSEDTPLGSEDREELMASVEEAATGVSRVGDIASSLLRLARKRKAAAPAPVDVRDVVQSCARIAANELRHRARYVEVIGEVPRVLALESELSQIVLNLLLNAAQAIAPGATNQNAITVSAGTTETGDFVWLEVADTGSGIAKAHLGRIFDPFFTTKDVGKGTGLGLAVSHSLVQSMGGELSVRSEVGVGTTFRLELPVAKSESDSAPLSMHAAIAPQRVLVVDDTEPVGRSIAALLRGHEVQVTNSGNQALEYLERGRFDVVISDVMMPQMTGVELYERAIAQRNELARRWIFVTGGTLTEDIDRALERIGAPIVTKPVARKELLAVVADRVRAA